MTDEYIKREDAKELFEMILESYKDAGIQNISMIVSIAPPEFHMSEDEEVAEFNSELDGWRNDFMKIEPADVAPVRHGHWIRMRNCSNAGIYCSACHKKVYEEQYSNTMKPLSPWCPNCGAKMDEDQDDEPLMEHEVFFGKE